MSDSQIFGMYKATVKRNDDPMSAQRLILRIPQVLGEADSEWAETSDPTSSVPRLGDVIWVQFSGGDVTKPVYIANGMSALSVDLTATNIAVDAAQAAADAAQTSANGKNKITYSLNVPGTTMNSVGDVWWRRDALGKLIGQWEGMGGTTWVSRQLSYQVIAAIDAATITVGQIQAGQLSADSINGKTITGANIRTGADGTARIVIGPDAYDGTRPAVTFDLDGSGVDWAEPYIEADPTTRSLSIRGAQAGLSASVITARGDGGIDLDAYDLSSVHSGLSLVGGVATVTGNLQVTGKIVGEPYSINSSTVATPDVNGRIYFNYGVGFTSVPWPVVSSGSGALICSGTGNSSTQGFATLYDAAGALVTAGLRRVNWTVTGILA